MDESEILGLHNAYREKYEQDFKPNTKTFVAESEIVSKYLQDLCQNATGQSSITQKQAFELKNRAIYIVKLT